MKPNRKQPYFHGTKEQNILSIAKEGLTPQRRGLDVDECVWLSTKDELHKFISVHKENVILIIDVDLLDESKKKEFCRSGNLEYSGVPSGIQYFGTIPPSAISIYRSTFLQRIKFKIARYLCK